MDLIVETLKQLRLHPVADHFTVALLFVGVLADLIGSLIPARRWIRYMALTLMIMGAAAAASSWLTGGWEAHRVKSMTTGAAHDILKDHAELGDWLVWIFAILALWRIGVEALGSLASSRPIYLIAAVVAIGLLGYQGYMGGEMVYGYGVGTALQAAAPSPASKPSARPGPSAAPTALPTVYVPTAAPTPAATTSSANESAATPTTSATAGAKPSPSASATAAGV